MLVASSWIAYRGIVVSSHMAFTLLLIELTVVVALTITLLVSVIQAGKFDNKSTNEEREALLRTLLETAEAADQHQVGREQRQHAHADDESCLPHGWTTMGQRLSCGFGL